MINRISKREYKNRRSELTAAFPALACLVLTMSSCGNSNTTDATDSVSDNQAVERAVAGVVEAANAGDLEALLTYFAKDGVAMPPNSMPVFGTKLIRPRIEPLFDQSRLTIFLTSEETRAAGNFAFARGYMSGVIESKNTTVKEYIEQNAYLMVLEKDSGGSWKIVRLMWHPMWPPPGPPHR